MAVQENKNITIKEGTIIGKNVIIEDNVYIDYNCIIRDNVTIKNGTTVGAGCIIGEYLIDFYKEHKPAEHPVIIGENAIIRSGTIIYGDVTIGNNFQSGHQVIIRENTNIGNNTSIGTLSDIQGNCKIGNYVRIHSNVFIAPLSLIDDYVWIYSQVTITNDPTPPSNHFSGVHIKSFAVIAAGSILLPGLTIEGDSLVAAGSVVTKDVEENTVVAGNPAAVISSIHNVKNHFTGKNAYPWRYHFEKYMPWEGIGYDNWIGGKNE